MKENEQGNEQDAGLFEAAIRELKRIEEDALHSAKSQFNAADRWKRRHYQCGALAIFPFVVAGYLAVTGDSSSWILWLAYVAHVILITMFVSLKPLERSAEHKRFGDRYYEVRRKARLAQNLNLGDLAVGHIKKACCRYHHELDGLNNLAPSVSCKDFLKAKAGIEAGEAEYMVDSERGGK